MTMVQKWRTVMWVCGMLVSIALAGQWPQNPWTSIPFTVLAMWCAFSFPREMIRSKDETQK